MRRWSSKESPKLLAGFRRGTEGAGQQKPSIISGMPGNPRFFEWALAGRFASRIMTDIKIDYESLAQDALRGVVRTVLGQVAQGEQLPGNHHFYISFGTTREGVGISKRLKDQYPDEMTIVLQHRYWDLQVHDDRFEVSLTFNSIPERLVIPFSALKVFFDPSVPYGLQFDSAGAGPPAILPDQSSDAIDLPQRRSVPKRSKPIAVGKPAAEAATISAKDKPAARVSERPAVAPSLGLPKPKPNGGALPPSASSLDAEQSTVSPAAEAAEARAPGRVVQLDTFRKK